MLKQHAQLFIRALTGLSPGLRVAYGETMRGSAPRDAVPAIMLLALGHRLADDIPAMDAGGRGRVFDAIEHALIDGDRELSAAAAGIIEAAVGRAFDLGTWPELRLMFRDRSAAHALTCVALDR